ncbi:MAG: ABC transporter permease [Coriobacteriaceae bacterium]|nr:ABC transporter permease [Coriobacteriaceae bacterium]
MLLEHIKVSALALGAASLVVLPLGVVCSYHPVIERISVGISSILRIVPSLATLIFLVPILGTGTLPAVVALAVLAMPPILINTALAFREVPAHIVEAAIGMGMGPARVFLTIRAPLAFPAAFAGFRTAATEVVASAALASYIGAGGLGEIIFTGMGLMRTDLLWVGGISVAALSLAVSFLLSCIDRRMRRYERA